MLAKVEVAVLGAIWRNGGSISLTELDRDPEVVKHFGGGVEAIDVASGMSSRGLVASDPDTKLVRATELGTIMYEQRE